MKRETLGEIIFWGTLVFALGLYCITAPTGLPWNGSTEQALAWSGYVIAPPEMRHPLWGYCIWLFGGHYVALSAAAAAIAGGLIGAMVNRHLGWRFGAAAALVWVMLPVVWNRAITGVYSSFVAFGIILSVWFVHAVFLFVTRRARAARKANPIASQVGHGATSNRGRINYIASWVALGAAVVFGIASASIHDYQIGEAASVYARNILAETGDRLVILNGVADDQMVWEEARRGEGEGEGEGEGAPSRLLLFRNDAAYRQQLVARVKRAWPADTNLWTAAQIGPSVLADVALKHHPDRVYVMTGLSTTPEKWEKRWDAMAPYLGSSDRFIPLMRRAFAYEGNTLANRLQEEGKLREAWLFYWRLYNEVDPGNASALINLSEMLRRGYATNPELRQRVERGMASLMSEKLTARQRRAQARLILAACGPVMRDTGAIAEMRARIEEQIKEMEKQGVRPELPPEWHSLIEWNNEMVRAHDDGNIDKAARIARTILSNPEWRSFIPANAVMGSAMAMEGDFMAAETFYRVALQGKGQAAPQPVILNDYADVLRHLGRYDEAEAYVRRAIAEDGGKSWLFKLTLAQVLRDAKRNPEEVTTIVDDLLKKTSTSAEIRSYVRKEFGR